MMFFPIFTFFLCGILNISLGKNAQNNDEIHEHSDEDAQKFINLDAAETMIGKGIDYAMKSEFVPPPAKSIVTVGKV